jgi:very-short-patch-repair endonuclease
MPSKGFTNDAIPALSLCESPIEGKFVQAWFDLMRADWRTVEYSSDEFSPCIATFPFSEEAPEDIKSMRPESYRIQLQYKFRGLRIDSMVSAIGCICGYGCAAVELDGRQFHSTTEQLDNDRKKGRLLATAGILCLRYSGSEIYANASGSALEVSQIIDNLCHHDQEIKISQWQLGIDCGRIAG